MKFCLVPDAQISKLTRFRKEPFDPLESKYYAEDYSRLDTEARTTYNDFVICRTFERMGEELYDAEKGKTLRTYRVNAICLPRKPVSPLLQDSRASPSN